VILKRRGVYNLTTALCCVHRRWLPGISRSLYCDQLASAVRTLDNALHWINCYPVVKCWQKKSPWIFIYPVDSIIYLSNNSDLAPRQYNSPMAGNPGDPAVSPHAVFQAPVTLSQWHGEGGPKDIDEQTQDEQEIAQSVTKMFQGPPCWNILVQWWSALNLANTIRIALTGSTSYSFLITLLNCIQQHLTFQFCFLSIHLIIAP